MFVLKLCLLILFAWCEQVQSDNSTYRCIAFGDPHVYTWRPKHEDIGFDKYQDCYRTGYYPLIKNEFLHFKIEVHNLWITEFELYFFDGVSKTPFCLITSLSFDILVHNPEQCQTNGIEWTVNRYGGLLAATISYAKAGFHTILASNAPNELHPAHINIEAFLPFSIVSNSMGICTLNDPYCSLNERSIRSKRTITTNQAQAACQIHADAFLTRTQQSASQRSVHINKTIAHILADCEKDVILTGNLEVANTGIDILLIEDLIGGLDSIDEIQTAIHKGIQNGLVTVDQAAEVAQVKISQLFEPTTDNITEYRIETTTPIVPTVYHVCNIYQSVYVQTWHEKNQLGPPARSCSGQGSSFHLIKNNYIEYTLQTDGFDIEQLTLRLWDQSSKEICLVWMTNATVGWSGCVQNGIKPSLVRSATHETLTVHYSTAHLTTIVTRDIGIFAGRFVIENSLPVESAVHSTGICNLLSPCTA